MSALPANVRTLMPPRAEVGPAEEATQLHPAMNEASSAPEPPLYVRTRAPEWLPRLLAPVIGLALFVAFVADRCFLLLLFPGDELTGFERFRLGRIFPALLHRRAGFVFLLLLVVFGRGRRRKRERGERDHTPCHQGSLQEHVFSSGFPGGLGGARRYHAASPSG